MELTNYIDTELYIIVPVLYVVGIMIKKSKISDKWIPLLLGIFGVLLATVFKFAVYMPNTLKEVLEVIFAGITQGILCAAGSVYANNIVKQMKKDDSGEEK